MLDEKLKYAPIIIVSAIGSNNRAIGLDNELLWHVPEDLKRFKKLTVGHPIIMGRKTFESIIKIIGKPLPNRKNIIITRNKDYKFKGVEIAYSLNEALNIAQSENPTEIHIGGGAELYKQILPLVSKLYITWFDSNKKGNVFFPDFINDFKITHSHSPQEHKGLKYQWIDYQRKN